MPKYLRGLSIVEALGDEMTPQPQQNPNKNKKRSFNCQGCRFDDKMPCTDEPSCPICHKNHDEQCRYEARPYHNCAQSEHFQNSCPKNPNTRKGKAPQKPHNQGLVNVVNNREAEGQKHVMEDTLFISHTPIQ